MESGENPVVGYAEGQLPTGGPRRLRIRPLWPIVAPFVVAGGAFVTLVGSSVTRTSGSTRSTRLTWQQRQAAVNAAVDAAAPRVSPADHADGAGDRE